MALCVLLFDRPADIDATGYRERSRNWIAELVRLDGFVEFSAHWNALHTSPNTMVLIRLASTEAAIEVLTKPALANNEVVRITAVLPRPGIVEEQFPRTVASADLADGTAEIVVSTSQQEGDGIGHSISGILWTIW